MSGLTLGCETFLKADYELQLALPRPSHCCYSMLGQALSWQRLQTDPTDAENGHGVDFVFTPRALGKPQYRSMSLTSQRIALQPKGRFAGMRSHTCMFNTCTGRAVGTRLCPCKTCESLSLAPAWPACTLQPLTNLCIIRLPS